MFHTGRKHGGAGLSVWQRHPHRHHCTGAVWIKSRFNPVVRGGIRQMHALNVNNPAIWLKFHIFAGDMESTAFGVGPLVTEFSAWSDLIDADGQRPTVRVEEPFLYKF